MHQAYIIGDTHGCLSELKQLVALAPPDSEIFCTGDLIDRGPDSRGVINFVRDNNITVTLGNHELMAIQCLSALKALKASEASIESAIEALNRTNWFYNGGKQMAIQYTTITDLVADIEYLDTFPTYLILPYSYNKHSLLISHTLIADKLNKDLSVEELVWDRSQHIEETKYFNVFGHTPVDYVLDSDVDPKPIISTTLHQANIDTGAPYNFHGRGYLSALSFPSLEVAQVKTTFD